MREMTVEELAAAVIDACEAENVDHMITGSFASSLYGVPRSTKDVDVVLSIAGSDPIGRISCDLIRSFDSTTKFSSTPWRGGGA